VGPFIIALFSFGLRLFHLGLPKGLVFDEVYYVGGARELLHYGVEAKSSGPEFIVHPPVGKWCIALGIKLFGDHEFGWRISVAVAGALTIYLVGRIAKRLFVSSTMSVDRISVSGPQSSAGILGISSNTNMGGWKFNPRGVVLFSAVFIVVVKIIDIVINRKLI